MSRNYDNWERLVAAVLRRQQLWEICHAHSRTPSSVSSLSSDFSFNSSFLDFAEDELLSSSKYYPSLPFQISASFRIDPRLKEKEPNMLVFFEGSSYTFGLEELLMASSNILSDKIYMFSSTFLVSLRHDIKVVVKKCDLNGVKMEKYIRIMRSVIEHENVAKLRAYYLSEDVMLRVYDYFPLGSVYAMLHGKGSKNRVYLDWETRVRIAFGAAKGIAHIHKQDSGGYNFHGNMSSSNVFLNSQNYGCLDDRGPFYYPRSRYKYNAPELSGQKRVKKASVTLSMHKASDVYSFGVFLIELVSGRLPWCASSWVKTYADWARHNYRDEWMTLVFDKGLLRNDRVKIQMFQMLEIAMSCMEDKVEMRPDIDHVVDMLELII